MCAVHKSADLSHEWSRRGGKTLRYLYNQRKQRGGFSMEALGKALRGRAKGSAGYVQRLMTGRIKLTPEHVETLASVLTEYPTTSPEEPFERIGIESVLATASGQQMPSLLRQFESEDELSSTLNLIAQLSKMALLLADVSGESPAWRQGSKWGLLRTEIELILDTWYEILVLERSLAEPKEKTRYLLYGELRDRWDTLRVNLDEISLPLQSAYAYTLWARALTVSGDTDLAITNAERALNSLGDLNRFPQMSQSYARMLGFRANLVLGDNYRAKGLFDVALKSYAQAREIIEPIEGIEKRSLEMSVDRKEFSAYLMARVEPPPNRVELMMQMSELNSGTDDIRASAFYSLAWLERSRRGEALLEAIRFGSQGLCHAKSYVTKTGESHVVAVGHQYLGETSLHFGDLHEAQKHLDAAAKLFQLPMQGRIGYTNLLLGRVYGYFALQLYETGQAHSCHHYLTEAKSCFTRAESAFLEGTKAGKRRYGSYQRAQLLIELAKWQVFEAVVEEREHFSQGAEHVRVPASKRLFESARENLSEAQEMIGWLKSDFYIYAHDVNQIIVDYVEWALTGHDASRAADIQEGITAKLNLISSVQIHPRGIPPGTNPFKNELQGHMARLYAMRGSLRALLGLVSTLTSLPDIGESARRSSDYDMLAVVDCRWLIGLADSENKSLDLFDSKLSVTVNQRLSSFLGDSPTPITPESLLVECPG